jgi:hypothetical protein
MGYGNAEVRNVTPFAHILITQKSLLAYGAPRWSVPYDLRRDRPDQAFRGRPALCGDSQREQGLSSVILRGSPGAVGGFRRPRAGCARDENGPCVRSDLRLGGSRRQRAAHARAEHEASKRCRRTAEPGPKGLTRAPRGAGHELLDQLAGRNVRAGPRRRRPLRGSRGCGPLAKTCTWGSAARIPRASGS